MDTTGEATLYPRYLPNQIPRSDLPVTVAGCIADIPNERHLTLEYDSTCTFPPYVEKKTVEVRVPSHIETNSLKAIKFIEVRGVAEENGEISMKEYTDLRDNFGTIFMVIQTSKHIMKWCSWPPANLGRSSTMNHDQCLLN